MRPFRFGNFVLPYQQSSNNAVDGDSTMASNIFNYKQILITTARLFIAICFVLCLYFLIVCIQTHHEHNDHHHFKEKFSLNNFQYNPNEPDRLMMKTTSNELNRRQPKSIKLSRMLQAYQKQQHDDNFDQENDGQDDQEEIHLNSLQQQRHQQYLIATKTNVMANDNHYNGDDNNNYSDCGYHIAFILIERDLFATKSMLKFSNTLKSILININSTGLDPGSLCIHLITNDHIRSHLLHTIDNVHEELTRQWTNEPYPWLDNHRSSLNNHNEHRPLTRYFFIDSSTIELQLEYLLPTLRTFFTHKPTSYYSNALFFYSIILHQVIPSTIADRIILLDIDVQLDGNILELFEEFGRFKPDEVIGIALEQQPVYRHILHEYRRSNNNTIVGSPPPNGFPGFNSGIVLLHLRKMRESKLYNSLLNQDVIKHICQKYQFRGHLGDQDFYTVTAIDHRRLYHTLSCGWNRQLCQWWRFHGYGKVFDDYHRCEQPIMLYHGNCNSALPTLTYYGAYRRR